uniref:Uncharacterized protein n=1 Tax=Magallana gigas TaxID=29159 RepID=K1Q3S8_MAGGI
MTSSISCYMLDGIQAYSMSVKVLGCPKLEKQRRWYMVVKGGRIFCSWVVLSSFVDALGNSLGCCMNVAIVESRPINVESCINCLFISLELYTGGPSGIRQTYPSFLPYGLQRAYTLYLIPFTPTFPHPVRTAHDRCRSRGIP